MNKNNAKDVSQKQTPQLYCNFKKLEQPKNYNKNSKINLIIRLFYIAQLIPIKYGNLEKATCYLNDENTGRC